MNIWQYTLVLCGEHQHLCLTITARSGMKPLETKKLHWQEPHFQ